MEPRKDIDIFGSFFASGLLAHGFMNFFTISWSGKNSAFYFDMVGHNQGITAFCLAEGGATAWLTLSYQCAVTARIMLIRNYRAHRSETAASSGEDALPNRTTGGSVA